MRGKKKKKRETRRVSVNCGWIHSQSQPIRYQEFEQRRLKIVPRQEEKERKKTEEKAAGVEFPIHDANRYIGSELFRQPSIVLQRFFFSFCGFQSLLLRLNNLFLAQGSQPRHPFSHTNREPVRPASGCSSPLPQFCLQLDLKASLRQLREKKRAILHLGNWGTGINIIHIKKFESISLQEEASPYPRGSSCTRLSIETQGGGPFFASQLPIENRVGKRRKRN